MKAGVWSKYPKRVVSPAECDHDQYYIILNWFTELQQGGPVK
jgi:hypothetical protein